MKKIFLKLFLINISIIFLAISGVSAQINTTDTQTVKESDEDHTSSVKSGKILYEKFKNKQLYCSDLNDDDFYALGEYLMEEHAGSSQRHEIMEQMMGAREGSEYNRNWHIWWGKRGTACFDKNISGYFGKGGGSMMGFGPSNGAWGYGGGMMSGAWGYHLVYIFIFSLVIFVDLLLLGIWLWKQIQKK